MATVARDADLKKSPYRWVIVALLFLGWILGGVDRTVMSFAIVRISKDLTLTAGQAGMIIVRALFGISEGPYSATGAKMTAMCFEKKELGKAGSLYLSSSGFVAILAPLFAGYMLQTTSWRNLFYMIGAAGLIVIVLFWVFLKGGGKEGNPAREKAAADRPRQLSYGRIFRIPMIWSLMLAQFTVYTITWGLSSWMPSYLVRTFRVNLKSAGWLMSLIGIGSLLGLLCSGFIIDRLSNKVNKAIVAIVGCLSTIALFCMFRGWLGVTSIVITQIAINFIMGYAIMFMGVLVMKQLPVQMVGRTMGTVLFAAQIGSFLAPLVMGFIVQSAGGNVGASFWYLFVCGAAFTVAIATMPTNVEKYLPQAS
jgi:sugar phosphate permease